MNHQQIIWASRRGMLELDILLESFAKQTYPNLPADIQLHYEQFLEEEDQDLFNWLLRKTTPDNVDFQQLIERIHENNRLSTNR